MGTLLVVGVTKDAFVGKGPGRPIIKEDDRLEMVRGLACVFAAELCENSIEAMEHWKPSIFCKGNDRKETGLLREEIAYCESHGIEIRFTKPNPQHSTEILRRFECESV